MKIISYEKLQQYLQEIVACDAFELHRTLTPKGTQNISIPYMMNDALECYIFLENSRITGQYLTDFKGHTSVTMTEAENGVALIFRQEPENVFTVWFETCYLSLTCYRYDQIGHFWVKGAEHWRRLVYIIGTIYDKYEYMGDEVCNEKELSLLPLMEFAPFRFYSPISESLDSYYEDTTHGLETMMQLAMEAGDSAFLRLLRIYEAFPYPHIAKWLAKELNRPARYTLYELIAKKVEEAASVYPIRTYEDSLNQKIYAERAQVIAAMAEHGYSGTYPLFFKEGGQIFAVEEHPFTVLDWEHFSFRIQFMISESEKTCQHLHYGFFEKRGQYGKIETTLDFLYPAN